jgi:hypothetical protein
MKLARPSPILCFVLLAATVVATTGCSGLSELVYDNKRQSAERHCSQHVSKTQNDECRAGARALPSYDEYEKQRQGASAGSNERAAARKDAQTKRDESLCFTRQATGERVCPN